MSVPGTGWGYDKDIAESLHDIAETLDRLLIHFTDKEEVKQEAIARSTSAVALGTVSGFADWLKEAINTEDGFKKAEKLRSILARANELRRSYQAQLDEVGNDGEAEQIQKAIKKDTA